MSAAIYISPKESPKKFTENTQNTLLVLEIFKVLLFSSFLLNVLRFEKEVKN